MRIPCPRIWPLAVLIVGLVACDREDSRSEGKRAQSPPKLADLEAPADDRSKEIEALTGGHTRIVWAQQQDPDKTDAHANGRNHKLMGLGTRDGAGERAILDKVGNYARPLLTPDGKGVVFTDKGMKKVKGFKSYAPRCFVVNWDGSGKKELANVYADALWQDPSTGITWVYGVEDFKRNNQIAVFGKTLVRFPLEDPSKREVIYAKGDVGVNNLQVSRDGTRIATLFPWPHGGVLDVVSGQWEATGTGCWTSMCPDNSYLSWVFDGAHKNVSMVHLDTNRKWIVSLSTLPDFQNKEMYHPRWSNHPRFLTITGPYPAGSRSGGGEKIETYIGRLNPGATRVDGWVRVTRNKLAELFPDVWIEGGEKESLDLAKLGKPSEGEPEVTIDKARAVETGTWPSNADGLVFAWDNSANETKIGDRPCRVTLRGRGRFGRFYDVVLGGGSAVPDADSLAAMGKAGPASTVEFVLTPTSDADGVVFSDGARVVFVADKKLYARTGKTLWEGGAIEAGVPSHLAMMVEGESGSLYRDGEHKAEAATVPLPEVGSAFVFGDGIWEGRVQGVGVYARVLSPDEIAANAATWKARVAERKPTERVVLRGKLVETTQLKTKTEIGAYNRALAVYTYEVEAVTKGDYPKEKVLVSHWYYMDDTFLTSMPREIGQTFELTVEPASDHPEIESELNDYEGADFETPVYFDVTTPEP